MKLNVNRWTSSALIRFSAFLLIFIFSTAALQNAQAAVPVTPTDVTATAGNKKVVLTWSPVIDAKKYVIRRATSATGYFSDIGSVTIPTTTFTDTGVSNGKTYYYVLVAVNGSGRSAPSSPPVAATPSMQPPTNLVASPGSHRVFLTWDAAPGVTSYKVRRATVSGAPYQNIATVNTTSFTNTELVNGTEYFYVVVSSDATSVSVDSNEVSATPVLAAPSGLTATASSHIVDLSWTSVAGAGRYRILRGRTQGGPYIGISSTTATSYRDTDVDNNVTYYYVVVAIDGTETSSSSNEVSATPILAAPSGLTATVSSHIVDLSWTSVAGAGRYRILRGRTQGGPYIGISSTTATSYRDTDVDNNVTYYYVVVAIDDTETSSPSNEVSATPVLLPPTGLDAEIGSRQVKLTWDAVDGADGYRVKRSTTSGGPVDDPYINRPITSETTYTDINLSNDTTYYYVVVAIDGDEVSGDSTEISATPILVPPANILAEAENLQVALSWDAVTNADNYRIYRATTSGGPYTLIATTTELEYVNRNLKNGVTYYYVLQAVDGTQSSANSLEVHATPALLPPVNIDVTVANRQVKLVWDEVANVDSYKIKRSTTAGGPYTVIGNSTTPTYTDTTVSNGKLYYYVIVSVDAGLQSANSAEVSGTPMLQAPENLAASAGNQKITLTWTASIGATSYKIRRATVPGGPYTQIASVSTTTYTNSSLKNGTRYYYVVAAANGSGTSVNSSEVSAVPTATTTTTATKLSVSGETAAPTDLTAAVSGYYVALQWQTVKGAKSYNVKRSSISGGPYDLVGTSTKGEFVDKSTRLGATYFYVVTAVAESESTPSEEAPITVSR